MLTLVGDQPEGEINAPMMWSLRVQHKWHYSRWQKNVM